MSKLPTNNGQPPMQPEHINFGQASVRTRVLRAAADAQLTTAGEKALHAHLASHPEDQAVIKFEQDLRRAIAANTFGEPSAALKERIQQMLGSTDQSGDSIQFATHPSIGRTHWMRSRPARSLAIAASIALLAGATYFTISQLSRNLTPPQAHQELVTVAHRAALFSFVSSHHDECELHADMVGHKLRIDSLDKAPAAFREVLGRAPNLGRLAASGLRFKGAGPCAVPGRGASVHMVFDAGAGFVGGTDGRTPPRTPMVSIFIQLDTGELNIEPGRTYRLVPSSDSSTAASGYAEIFVWKADGFIYFLSSTLESALEKARLALGASEPSGTL